MYYPHHNLQQQFLPFLLWNNDIKKYTASYNGYTSYDYLIPLIRYIHESGALIEAFKSFINIKNNSERIKGYIGVEQEWNDDLEKAKSEVDYLEIKIDTIIVKLFEQFINECNDNGIKLILIYSPEQMEGQNFIKNRKEIISKYQYLANKYKIPFIDYSNDELCNQKQFFYNAEHLNKKGSELFTKKLIVDIKPLIYNN